ncbi:ComEC/Rec2 family competence protein [Streptomyces roseifaciens]|uniref:ComEC/Rec2 family competence protein n=1 Tax=Streptomyces roseifaciens TaxID=1488406 RepID=UPI0007181044|nr:hypothetical protein [Streptomyces roseifaciens]
MPVEVIFFNVGQGDCTFLYFYKPTTQDGGIPPVSRREGIAAVLIDCGSTQMIRHDGRPETVPWTQERQRDLQGARIREKIRPYLERLPRPNRLNHLVLSHPDIDHFNLLSRVIGERDDSTGRFRLAVGIGKVWYSGYYEEYWEAEGEKFIQTLLRDPEELRNGTNRLETELGMPMSCFRPEPMLLRGTKQTLHVVASTAFTPTSRKVKQFQNRKAKGVWSNASGIAMLLSGADLGGGVRQKLHLMSDTTMETEKWIMTMHEMFPEDAALLRRTRMSWLKMGHHGSATSTSQEWIKHIRPDVLLASAGAKLFGGKTGHPPARHLANVVLPAWRDLRPTSPQLGKTPGEQALRHDIGVYRDPGMLWRNSLRGHYPATYEQGIFTSNFKAEVQLESPERRVRARDGQRIPAYRPVPQRDWTAVDWHLVFDAPNPGDYRFWHEP